MSITGLTGTSTSNRITGMVSGLDTDTIVKNLTSATRSKIAAAKQQSELLEWKRDAYRDIISSVLDFKNKYYSLTSETSLLNSSAYNQMSFNFDNAAISQYLSVTSNGNAQTGKISIENVKIATQSMLKTNGFVSKHAEITADFSSGPLELTNKIIDITVAGTTKTLTLSKSCSSTQELAAEIQAQLNNQFSKDHVTVSINGNKLQFNAGGDSLSLNATQSDAFSVPGMNLTCDTTSLIDINSSLKDTAFANTLTGGSFSFKINDTTFNFEETDTLAQVISKVNSSNAGVKMAYSSILDSLVLTSVDTGSNSAFTFEDISGNLLSVITGSASSGDVVVGNNAEMYLNSVKIVRSENYFTIDGLTFDLKASYEGSISGDVTQNTDKLYSIITSFKDDYNKLIDSLNDKIDEKYDRKYPPLTDEQRKEMSESEIENWEKKAKTGLLSNDSTIRNMLQNLRSSLIADVKSTDDNGSIGLSLSDIGITTGIYTEKGKLQINETKLREAIKNNSSGISKLFTQKSSITYSKDLTADQQKEYYNQSGLMQRFSSILDLNVKTNKEYGLLLKIAGYKNSSTLNDNVYKKRIDDYNDKIEELQTKLSEEEDRYYKQFASLESSLSSLNQQSSWLTQMMS